METDKLMTAYIEDRNDLVVDAISEILGDKVSVCYKNKLVYIDAPHLKKGHKIRLSTLSWVELNQILLSYDDSTT